MKQQKGKPDGSLQDVAKWLKLYIFKFRKWGKYRLSFVIYGNKIIKNKNYWSTT